MKRFLLILTSLFLVAPFALGQGSQSGSLTGTVTVGGSVMPGVTVTIESPALQGKRTQVTGPQGEYVFKFLPPGSYAVVFELSGMRKLTQTVTLELGAAARSDAVLEPTATAEVLVTGQATEVQKAAVHETSLNFESVQALPIGRTIDQIAALAPAVTTNTPNAGQLKINGGFAYDNVFMVDGADVDDHYFASPTNVVIIEDAVQETQVLTSNISAEYGRFSGGVVNAITKSGGNDYHGNFRVDFTNDAWKANTPFETANDIDHPSKVNETYTGTLGGKILTDRLWFFVAGRYFNNSNQTVLPVTAQTFTANDKEPRIEGKLTVNISDSHSLQGAYTYSNEEFNGVPFDFTIDQTGQVFPSQPADLWIASYNGVLTSNLFASLRYSQKKFEFKDYGGTSPDIHDSPFISTAPTFAQYGGPYFDATDPEHRNNQQFNASLNYFLTTSSLGTHDVKLGGEVFKTTEIGGNSQSSTGYVFYYVDYLADANGNVILDPSGRVQPSFIPTPDGFQLLLNWLPMRGAKAHLTTSSVYFNDSWKITSNLSANLGVRYETISGVGPTGASLAKNHSWVPRLGAAYDIKGDGRYVLSGSYSEYAGGANPNNFFQPTNVGTPNLVYYLYTGPPGSGFDFAPGFDLNNWVNIGGSFPAANVFNCGVGVTDCNLKTPTTREFTVSAGGQMAPNAYAAVTYVDRKTRNFIDQFYLFENGKTDVVVDGVDYGFFDNKVYNNTDVPRRAYSAIAFQGRYSVLRNLNVDLNYTYMLKFDGNYEGENTNQPALTPGLSSYPEILVPERNNPAGRLAGFQRHKVRMLTSYNLPTRFGNFGFGLIYLFDSGTPYSARFPGFQVTDIQKARDPGYANPPRSEVIYFGSRGNEIFPSQSRFDLAFNYDIPVFKAVSPYFKATVFNVFNTHYRTGFNTTILPCDPNQELPAACNGQAPVDADGIPTTFVRSSSFGQAESAADYQGARRFLLSAGIRF